jgi:type III secretory pathway component EscR
MKKNLFKKLVLGLGSVTIILSAILCVHIYQVTHSKITDPNAIALARIDFNQPFTQEDATKFGTWLNKQTGVQRAAFNSQYQNAVFAYYPVKVNASQLVQNFCNQFNVNAKRYLPSKKEMMKGCPVAMN